MELWSTAYIFEPGAEDWATCAVDVAVWRRITEEQEGAKRIFACIQFGEASLYCALGAPVQASHEGGGGAGRMDRLYLPAWRLEQLGIDGCGEIAQVEWFSEEAFPEATRIVLRPHDSAFYHADAKEELERGLTRLGVLNQGQTITVPMSLLGDFPIQLDVVRTEPAGLVLAEGDEVALEFEEAHDRAMEAEAAVARAAEAAAAAAVAAEFADCSGMIPLVPMPAPPAGGQRLGGAAPRLTADGRRWNPWRDGPGPKV
jgi:hypothetical protein